MQSPDFRGRSSTPAVLPRRQPLILPPPIHQMPRPLTNSDRDAVRAEFVRCYDAIKEQKDLLLSTDDSAVHVVRKRRSLTYSYVARIELVRLLTVITFST